VHRIPVNSAAVAAVGYDGRTRVLEIEFRSGAVYRYYGVPMPVYHDFLRARPPRPLSAVPRQGSGIPGYGVTSTVA
jgi:KTSC domain-containing protein